MKIIQFDTSLVLHSKVQNPNTVKSEKSKQQDASTGQHLHVERARDQKRSARETQPQIKTVPGHDEDC